MYRSMVSALVVNVHMYKHQQNSTELLFAHHGLHKKKYMRGRWASCSQLETPRWMICTCRHVHSSVWLVRDSGAEAAGTGSEAFQELPRSGSQCVQKMQESLTS